MTRQTSDTKRKDQQPMSTTTPAFGNRLHRIVAARNIANMDYQDYGRSDVDHRIVVAAERNLDRAISVANDAVAVCRFLATNATARAVLARELSTVLVSVERIARRADSVGAA